MGRRSSRQRPAATCSDLQSPDADNNILVLNRGGGRLICLIFATTIKATLQPHIGSVKIGLRIPGSMPKYGGRSLVVACGNYTLVAYDSFIDFTHFVIDLSPKTDLSLFVKSAPGPS